MGFRYAIDVKQLSDEDGGGYVAEIPELVGCTGDGSTPEEAINDVKAAAGEWLNTAKKRGRFMNSAALPS